MYKRIWLKLILLMIISSQCFSQVSVTVSAQNNADEDTTAQPAISEAGKPNGKIVEMKMNKEGGTLVSGDGKLELIIPSDALSKKITISIQPITNTIPNGNGQAYRLEPSGIRFQKPVQIIFHYTPEESADSMQLLMGIAMQDNTGQWYSLNKFTLDTVAKTISGNINHFSDWSKFDALKLVASKARVKVKNSVPLQFHGMEPFPKETDGADLTFLNRTARKAIWHVNNIVQGNSVVGTLHYGTADYFKPFNIYYAPASVPDQNPVAISVKLQTVKYNGYNFKDLTLVCNILIYDNAYEITMVCSFNGSAGSMVENITYRDTGSFVVSLNGKDSKIIEKVNKNANAELNYIGKCTVKRLKTGYGNIHIVGRPKRINITEPSSPTESTWVEIEFQHIPSIMPLLQFTCPYPSGPITSTNAKENALIALIPTYPQRIRFEAKEGEQIIFKMGEEGGELFVITIVKQLKDD